MKKITSIILTIVMVFSLMPIIGITAGAESMEDFPVSMNDIGYSSVQAAVDAATDYEAAELILLKDQTLSATITIPKTKIITLDLNGHTLDASELVEPEEKGEASSSVIYNEGNLTITDSSDASNGKITGGSGTYLLNSIASCGGGIYNKEGTLNICNGLITGNKCTYGAGVYNDGGVFTLSGGAITKNICRWGGGGVYNDAYYKESTLYMTGGTISDNTFEETNEDTSDITGGGIFNYPSRATVTITGGTISGNTAGCGGGINSYGKLNISNCSITNNSTISGLNGMMGGGIYCEHSSNSSVSLSDTVIIKNNTTQINKITYSADLCLNVNSSTDTIVDALKLSDFDTESEIGILTMIDNGLAPCSFTENCDPAVKDCFFSNNSNYKIKYTDENRLETYRYVDAAETTVVLSGIIQDSSLNPVLSASVMLRKGKDTYAKTTTDAEGNFTFNNIPYGVYNIVITKGGKTTSQLYTVPDYTSSITMPDGSAVIEAYNTGAVVGGLDKISTQVADKYIFTLKQEDTTTLTTEQQAIREIAPNSNIDYFEAKLKNNKTEITELDDGKLLSMVLPYNTGRRGITAYRYHNNTAEAFTQVNSTENPQDGTYYIDYTNNLIYIFASKFSTYAVSYTRQHSSGGGGGSSPTSYTITTETASGGSVTVSPKSASSNKTVTITLNPDSGYAAESVSATDAAGNPISVMKTSDTIYTFTMPSANVIVNASFKAEENTASESSTISDTTKVSFVDVKSGDYFFDAVNWAVNKEITKGTENAHFSPESITSRAQMITFLWRASGSPEPQIQSCPFSDIKSGGYYEKAVLWAIENNITTGTSDKTFSPNETITRAQAVTFLWRYLGASESEDTASNNPFMDITPDKFYYTAVQFVFSNGITSGISATEFAPNQPCTRGQIITFLYRALNNTNE